MHRPLQKISQADGRLEDFRVKWMATGFLKKDLERISAMNNPTFRHRCRNGSFLGLPAVGIE